MRYVRLLRLIAGQCGHQACAYPLLREQQLHHELQTSVWSEIGISRILEFLELRAYGLLAENRFGVLLGGHRTMVRRFRHFRKNGSFIFLLAPRFGSWISEGRVSIKEESVD